MLFKGVLVLSYTALLVTPTNAAFPHRDEVLGKRDSLTARRYNRLNRRQQPWSNQTTVPEVPETQEPVVPGTSTPIVIVPTPDDLPSTSAAQDEVTSTSEVPTTTEAPIAETSQQTTAFPTTSSRSHKPTSKQPEPTSVEDHGSESTTSQQLPNSAPTLSASISSTEAIATESSSIAVPDSTEAAPSEVTSSAAPSATDPAISSEASWSLEQSTTAVSVLTTTTEVSETSSSAVSETTEDATTVSSSAEPSTSDAKSEVPQTTSEDPTLSGSTETLTPSRTRSRQSDSVPTPEPTATDVLTSSTADTTTSAEETVALSPTLTEETTETEIETPTRSRTRLGTVSETSQTEEPTTTSFEATVTSHSKASTDFPETTAPPSLPDPLSISSIISDVENVTSAIESVVSSVESGMDNVPPAISSVLSSVDSDVGAIPTEVESIVSSIVSSVKSDVDALPTGISSIISPVKSNVDGIPTDVSSIISSVKSNVDAIPTEVSSAISSIVSELLTSVKPVEPTVPASETASDAPTTSAHAPISTSTGDGISFPGASGTGATPSVTPTDAPVSSTDGAGSTVTPTADPTSAGVSDATTASSSSAPLDSDLPSLSLFAPSAAPTPGPSEPSDLASTDIFTSETQVNPTPTDTPTTSVGKTSAIETRVPASETSVTGVSSGTIGPTLAPANETSVVVSSGLSDAATLVPTSGLGVSMTSGSALPTGITTSASIAHPTDPALAASTVSTAVQVDTLESQVPIDAPIPTSESITNPKTSANSVEKSPTPSHTEAIPTATDEATSQASNDPASETDAPSDDPTDSPSGEVPTETSAQLGPPPTKPTGFVSADPAAKPSASSTEAPLGGAGGEEKPPPLSKSQTAGIAVGGTTCLLVALVAALFLARRYHSNMSNKRHSTGDVYPEMAYIYDPPTGGNGNHDAEAGCAVPTGPTMSGAAGGALGRSLSSASVYGPAPQGAAAGGLARSLSKASSHRHSIGPVYTGHEQTASSPPLPRESRYSTGSYLSTGPWDPSLALNAAAAASSVSLDQYKDEAAQNPFREPQEPKPVANRPAMGGTVKGPLTVNPYAFNVFNNTLAAREYPPMSPYGPAGAANRSSSPVRARASERHSDPFADPFEHDLILNVDMRTATESSITVLALPPTPRSGRQTPSRGPSPNPYEFCPPPAPFGSHFPGRDSDSDSLIPEPLTLSGGNTPERRQSPMPRESPDSQRTLVRPPPAHVGPAPGADNNWGNKGINHPDLSNPNDVPRPLFPKKPLPLRLQPTLAGPGQTLLASTGLPLTIKRKPMGNGSISGVLDVPRNHHLSPSMSPSQADFSDDPTVQRKRSGEIMFADPALVGRAQF